MKNSLLLLLLLTCFMIAGAQNKKSGYYKPVPKKFTPVNDYALLLTTAQNKLLSDKISQFKDSTGNVVVIITHKSLTDAVTQEQYSIEEAALHYFNNWKIGQKEKNNGILIFIAKEDRKVRITTGKGIEKILPADDCQRIINDDIVPAFKQQDYYSGLDAGLRSIVEILNLSPYSATPAFQNPTPVNSVNSYSYNSERQEGASFISIAIIVVIGLILLIIIGSAISRENTYHSAYNTYDNDPYYRSRSWWFPYFLTNWFINDHQQHSSNNNSSDNSYSSNDSSFGNDSSSSSGSSDSFGGGSSDGGGASGSW